jgi:hypothetical protein
MFFSSMKTTHAAFGCLVIAGVGIGLPTYLLSCDAALQPHCARVFIANATVVGYSMVTSSCESGSTSFCYTSSATVQYVRQGKARTCSLLAAHKLKHSQVAQSAANNAFPLGSTVEVFVDRTTHSCMSKHELRVMAIVGLLFLCLGFVGATLWLALAVVHCTRRAAAASAANAASAAANTTRPCVRV